jgi:hypothetical protein
MSNFVPQKISTQIMLIQDSATKGNQQVTTITPRGDLVMNGFSINNMGYTDNYGDIVQRYAPARTYKIQTLATIRTLANRKGIVHNKEYGNLDWGSVYDNSYKINLSSNIKWRGSSGKYSLINDGDMLLGDGADASIYNNGFWLNTAYLTIGNGQIPYREGPGRNIGIDNQEGGTIDFNYTPITLGANSGRWYNKGKIYYPGDITTLDITGLEKGLPMIINDHLISFSENDNGHVPTVNAIISNNGIQGDGSGIEGIVTFIAPLDDEGNLLPGSGHDEYGTITFQKRYKASGVLSGGEGKAHEFQLASNSNNGDKLVSLQGVDLGDIRMLDVNYDSTPSANQKNTIFQSKPGAGNTTGKYNDPNVDPYPEGYPIIYTTTEAKLVPIPMPQQDKSYQLIWWLL